MICFKKIILDGNKRQSRTSLKMEAKIPNSIICVQTKGGSQMLFTP